MYVSSNFFTVKKIKKVPVTQKIQRKKQMKPLIFLQGEKNQKSR